MSVRGDVEEGCIRWRVETKVGPDQLELEERDPSRVNLGGMEMSIISEESRNRRNKISEEKGIKAEAQVKIGNNSDRIYQVRYIGKNGLIYLEGCSYGISPHDCELVYLPSE